ncbi:MAG: tetratricopeptide repeat protein, partial [Bacteroidota bacterium]
YAYYFAGIAYLQNQQPYKAINRLRNSISLNPRFKQAYQALSQAYKQTGQEQQAQQVLNMAKQIQ